MMRNKLSGLKPAISQDRRPLYAFLIACSVSHGLSHDEESEEVLPACSLHRTLEEAACREGAYAPTCGAGAADA